MRTQASPIEQERTRAEQLTAAFFRLSLLGLVHLLVALTRALRFLTN
jgi:hypothetical protein